VVNKTLVFQIKFCGESTALRVVANPGRSSKSSPTLSKNAATMAAELGWRHVQFLQNTEVETPCGRFMFFYKNTTHATQL
jgi:hypothetical protein